jgi:ATP sulfurylase
MSDPYDPDDLPRSMPRQAPYAPMPRSAHADELLIRIDERTRQMADEMKGLKEVVITRAEFAPVRLIAYGLVGLILTLVITAMVATVIIKTK